VKKSAAKTNTQSQTEAIAEAKALMEEFGYSAERLSMLEIPESDPLYTAMHRAKKTKKFEYD
jgi:hypothetical protein